MGEINRRICVEVYSAKAVAEPPHSKLRAARLSRRPLQNLDFDLDGLAFAFAALGEPGGEAFGETLGSQAEAGFQAAVGKR